MPGSIGDSSLTEVTQVKTKLPKLQLNKFNGDPKVWNECWDSYGRVGMLKDEAASAVAG